MYKYISIFFLIFISIQTFANSPFPRYIEVRDDSCDLQISILTNTPSARAVYTMYGHTSIRVKNDKLQTDVVFNYGVFSFEEANFLYRFVKGETYYKLEPEPFKQYEYRYALEGVGIIEQVLNLKCEDKNRIWHALIENSKEQNKTYLYNFFFDNCSTRPRDIIQKNISSKITYAYPDKVEKTFRDLVHECVGNYPWVEFGIDLVLGSPADEKTTRNDRMFLPEYLMSSYDIAQISDSGTVRSLVEAKHDIAPSFPIEEDKPESYPLIVGFVLLVVTALISFFIKNKIILGIFDFLLFAVAGLAGCIIFFLMFFSIHPCMSPNWNLVWLNPIMLIIALISPLKISAKYVYYYHFINFALLALFSLAWFLIPQTLNVAFLPYILSLCFRSGANVYLKRKTKFAQN